MIYLIDDSIVTFGSAVVVNDEDADRVDFDYVDSEALGSVDFPVIETIIFFDLWKTITISITGLERTKTYKGWGENTKTKIWYK